MYEMKWFSTLGGVNLCELISLEKDFFGFLKGELFVPEELFNVYKVSFGLVDGDMIISSETFTTEAVPPPQQSGRAVSPCDPLGRRRTKRGKQQRVDKRPWKPKKGDLTL
jgi:hypothetical protein